MFPEGTRVLGTLPALLAVAVVWVPVMYPERGCYTHVAFHG